VALLLAGMSQTAFAEEARKPQKPPIILDCFRHEASSVSLVLLKID
jgi:hypothetical protein